MSHALDVRILRWFARLDEVLYEQVDTDRLRKRLGDELRAIVAVNEMRILALGSQPCRAVVHR